MGEASAIDDVTMAIVRLRAAAAVAAAGAARLVTTLIVWRGDWDCRTYLRALRDLALLSITGTVFAAL